MKHTKTTKRFNEFKRLLMEQVGYKPMLQTDGRVTIMDGYYLRDSFGSMQQAIDHYAYLLPSEFVNVPLKPASDLDNLVRALKARLH